MFNNLCLPERAAEPVQLALIESRAESKLKHILTAQLLALKERALGKRSAAPRTNKQPRMCTTRSGLGGGEDVYAFSPTQKTHGGTHGHLARKTS